MLGVAEVLDHLVRLVGVDEEDAVLDLAQLGLAAAFPIDADLAGRAGRLRACRYHRRTRAVSLADCVLVEVARREDRAVETSDPHYSTPARPKASRTSRSPMLVARGGAESLANDPLLRARCSCGEVLH